MRFCYKQKLVTSIRAAPAFFSWGTVVSLYSKGRCNMATQATQGLKMIDIGVNLLDEMYQGRYNGKEYHAADLNAVLERSWKAGISRIIMTAGNLQESKAALELACTDERLFCTVGCHPTRCGEFEAYEGGANAYLEELLAVAKQGQARGKVVAVGECGLDYDRLHFCEKEVQQKYFAMQFKLAHATKLPMFLHLRAAAQDFLEIVRQHDDDYVGGVVHSFDGTMEELQQILKLPKLSIGINGCSLKTEENLQVARAVPLDRLMLETDCPWCEIRSTHAAKRHIRTTFEAKDKKKHNMQHMVKSRNEPCNLIQVLEVLAGLHESSEVLPLADQVYENTCRLFFPSLVHSSTA